MPANPLTIEQPGIYAESRRLHYNIGTAAGAAGTYTTKAIVVPKFAIIVDVIVHAVALWNSGTSDTGIVGDATDDDGYYTAINMSATDLTAIQSLSFANTGGKEGAYLVGTATHWTTRYTTTARKIVLKVTAVGTVATTGETILTVVYAWSPPTRPITGGVFVSA